MILLVFIIINTNNIMTDLHFKPQGDCIFLHIPKTAGISIYESVIVFQRNFGWFYGTERQHQRKHMKNELHLNKFPTKGATMLGHFHYQALMDANILNPRYFHQSFKFTFVRNPYDRLVSLYNYHQIKKKINLEFDDFVEILHEDFKENRVPPVGLYNIKSFPETSPLHHPQIHGNQYNPMVDWLPKEDVLVCYLETFEQDIDKVLNIIGFEGKREKVPRKNVSKNEKHFMEYYSKRETIDRVNQIYKADFEAFGYEML